MAERTQTQLWELRFKGSHGKMENVLVEVDYVKGQPPTEQDAKVVCDSYLEWLANPAYSYTRHRPIVIWNSAKTREQQKTHSTIHDEQNAAEARRQAARDR